MKKLFVSSLLVLLTTIAAHTQGNVSIIKQLIDGKECDSCDADGRVAYTEHLNYIILDANEEFVHRTDTLAKLNGVVLKNLSRHAVSSPGFVFDFIPSVKKTVIPYHELEFQVLQNKRVIQEWKSVTVLPQEKNYRITCVEAGNWDNAQECPAFQAGRFSLNIGDELLVRIRKKHTVEVLRNISIERYKIVPEVDAIRQFPSGTSIQDILNRVLKRGDGRLISRDELEVEPGNSVLISFDLGLNNDRWIEYAYTDDPDNWQPIENLNYTTSQLPAYLFIDNPKPGKTIGIMLRYTEQRESIRHLRIIVKPKLTQTTAFILTASLVLAFLLFMMIYYLNKGKNKRQMRQLLSKKKELENKLQLLSGQFNPHFLFNSLNSIQNLINKAETEEANAYISQVAGFLRTVMNAGKKEFISLQEELDITEDYLQLEQKKRSFRYTIVNRCEIALSQIDFPPLLLQPVLENSIHHGFTKEIIDPAITIEVTGKGKELRMIVSDNGKGFDPAIMEKAHGLNLVEKRISLMNEKPGNNIKMDITSNAEKGTITTFTFNNWL